MITLDDLARLIFETDPGLVDTVWNDNTEEMGKSFIGISNIRYKEFCCRADDP